MEVKICKQADCEKSLNNELDEIRKSIKELNEKINQILDVVNNLQMRDM